MPTVTLRNGRSFKATLGETILDAATAQQIVLEHSCRTGRCGVCIARLVSGTASAIRAETSLSPADQADGRILTCCRTADTDLALDLEPLDQLAGIRRSVVPCRIASLVRHGEGLLVVTLRLPPNARFAYVAGQYVNIIRGGISRSYSLASPSSSDNRIELHIRCYDGGAMSAYWFNEAKEGDLLRMEGPLGTFFLRSVATGQLAFLCTGTGIAPVKAILEQLANQQITDVPPIHLFWGNRLERDFFWDPGDLNLPINYVPVVSRPHPDWHGATGHVQDHLFYHITDIEDSDVYACGSNAMITDLEMLLTAAGHSPHRYYYDAFVSSI